MKLIADLHTHTVSCGHAYSTISENLVSAGEKGLLCLAITEHAGIIPGAPPIYFFKHLDMIPRKIGNVVILRGVETNVIDHDGTLDFDYYYADTVEWTIASMHEGVLIPGSVEEHTKSWLRVSENPVVDMIGHCGTPDYDFDHEKVIKAFRKNNKIVEINASSGSSRPGSDVRCKDIARFCKKYGVRICLNSDAHFHSAVGNMEHALEILYGLDFPEELVINSSVERLNAVFAEKGIGVRL